MELLCSPFSDLILQCRDGLVKVDRIIAHSFPIFKDILDRDPYTKGPLPVPDFTAHSVWTCLRFRYGHLINQDNSWGHYVATIDAFLCYEFFYGSFPRFNGPVNEYLYFLNEYKGDWSLEKLLDCIDCSLPQVQEWIDKRFNLALLHGIQTKKRSLKEEAKRIKRVKGAFDFFG